MAYDEELAERLRELTAGEAGLSEKRMFGGLAFLINGNMAVAASGRGGLMLRIDPAQHEKLVAKPHAGPMEMRGREVAGWIRVEPAGVRTAAALRRWASYGLEYARSLPAK
jgi:TfoX/Sxy family transcriptional regulator of competence genes